MDCPGSAEEKTKKEPNMFKKITLGAAAVLTAVSALPAAAEARGYNGYYDGGYAQQYRNDRYAQSYRNDRYAQSYNDGYYRERTYRDSRSYRGARRCSGTTGTIVGGAAGALAGRAIDSRGSRTTGTIIGLAAGALLGREVGKSSCRR
jgi:opacity protein-like surface antigen